MHLRFPSRCGVLLALAVACSPAAESGGHETGGVEAGGNGSGDGGGAGVGGGEPRDAGNGGSGGGPAGQDAAPGDEGTAGSSETEDADTAHGDGSSADVDASTITADAGGSPSSPDAGTETGNPCPGYKKGTHTQTGVSIADFCAAYSKSCMFQSTDMHFKDEADCDATYGAATAPTRTCLAGHLCEAIASKTANGKSSNCQAAGHGTVCN